MKIVKKIKLWLERDGDGEMLYGGYNYSYLFRYYNNSDEQINICLFSAYSISGEMFAMSELVPKESPRPESRIYFEPNINDTYDNPEYQLRTFPYRDVSAEVEDSPEYLEQIHKAYIPLKIPPGTKRISIAINSHGWVQITACYDEEYVIIDDNGNEIPLENLLGGKHSS